MTSKDFGIRPGEQTVDLPANPACLEVHSIGRIRTPWTERKSCPKNAGGSKEVCTVQLDERFVPPA